MTTETCCRARVFALLVFIVTIACLQPVQAQSGEPLDDSGLSSYWRPVVSRWEDVIIRYSERRGLDPDFVASVIWKESRGISDVRGPTGAVGLMCVKPFPWRPSAEELENPWTNVAAGTLTLSHVLRDGKGDAYYSLAAYNGGWDKIHKDATRRYAADVLDNYVRAVAVEHGFEADGDWVAILSVEGLPDHTTLTVLGPNRPLARYTERPWSRARIPSVPGGDTPHATLIRYEDEHGREVRVNLWILAGDIRSAFRQDPSTSGLSTSAAVGRGISALAN